MIRLVIERKNIANDRNIKDADKYISNDMALRDFTVLIYTLSLNIK